MKYSLDKQERYSVLTLNEDNLNSLIAPKLKSDFILLQQEGIKNMIFDLSNTKFVDSSGLSAILTAHRLFKEDGAFVLTGKLQPGVKKLIEISKLDIILNIVPTVDEAIDLCMMEELERELTAED